MRAYPFGPPDRLRLHPTYARLREDEPLARVQMAYGEPAWLVTRYADVRTVMGDARFSRAYGRDEPRAVAELPDGGIFNMDPPAHTRLRGLVAKAFTVRRVEQLRERTQALADRLVDAMITAGPPLDLVEHFATPLPAALMCELLGVPVEDRRRFGTWTTVTVSTPTLTPAKIAEYRGRLDIYMNKLIEARRREPTDADLLGALVHARDNDDRLTEKELRHFAISLLAAGFETTATEIPNFIYALLTHPHLREQLWTHPDLVPTAVEELLRYCPIMSFAIFPRYATTHIELSGGTVHPDQAVLPVTAAANRDPTIFTNPDHINLTRTPNPHLALGHGAHHCLGAPLARMELQTTLTTLIHRLPNLRLAIPAHHIPWRQHQLVNGPATLPITW